MKKFITLTLFAIACTISHGYSYAAPTFEVTDLPDAAGDPNRMTFTYRLDDLFEAGGGITFFYDAALFSDLLALDPGSDWFASITQPDFSAGLEGLVSFMALTDITTSTQFEVQFAYLGARLPGSQRFELFNSGFDIVSSGRTTAVGVQIPEPATLLLISLGPLAFVTRRRRRGH